MTLMWWLRKVERTHRGSMTRLLGPGSLTVRKSFSTNHWMESLKHPYRGQIKTKLRGVAFSAESDHKLRHFSRYSSQGHFSVVYRKQHFRGFERLRVFVVGLRKTYAAPLSTRVLLMTTSWFHSWLWQNSSYVRCSIMLVSVGCAYIMPSAL